MTHNGDPRVGKLTVENLKISNFPWVASLAPHRIIDTFSFEDENNYRDEI